MFVEGFADSLDEPGHAGHFPSWVSFIWGGDCHTHLLELLDLGLLKHGEHVGASAFYPLLGFLWCLGRKQPLDTAEAQASPATW